MRLSDNTLLQGGKYQVLRVIGQGGFGITYLALDTALGRLVAIKEFFPKEYCDRDATTSQVTVGTRSNEETVRLLRKRFLKEARNLASVKHEGIVAVLDSFEENATAYYVMEYVEGENLNELVKRQGPLSPELALQVVKQVGAALDYLHQHNMTHFDVKPANIMLRRSDNSAVLIDFGLSKQFDGADGAATTTIQAVSQGYSPIELYNQGSKPAFSPQTDIYSLGATLYYLLSGQVPPTASDIINDGLTMPEAIPEGFRPAIEAAMKVARKDRPESVEMLMKQMPLAFNSSYNAYSTPSDSNSESDETVMIGEPVNPMPFPNPPDEGGNDGGTPDTGGEDDEKENGPSIGMVLLIMGVIGIIIWIIVAMTGNHGEETYNADTLGDSVLVDTNAADSTVALEVTGVYFDNDSILTVSRGMIRYVGYVDYYWNPQKGKYETLPNGYGSATFVSPNNTSSSAISKGDKYTGDWSEGNMEGKGTYYCANGDRFEGEFVNNNYTNGRYTISSTGEFYQGTFRNNQPLKGGWYNSKGELIENVGI